MAIRRLIPALLFGFAFQLTLVVMRFAGFGARATHFENLLPQLGDIVSWGILPACVAAVVIYTGIFRKSGGRTARRVARRAWIVAFMCGVSVGMAATSMGLAGGFWGPSMRWHSLLRQASTAVVLVLAYGGAAFALIDTVSLWRAPRDANRKKANLIAARLILAAVLLLYGTGNALGTWASRTAFAALVVLLICVGSALDVLTD